MVVAVTLAAALALPALLALAFATPAGRAWGDSVAHAVVSWEHGPWKVLRGGLKWITPPAVAVTVLVTLGWAWRTGRRRAAVLGLVLGAGAFLTVEAIKLGLVPFPDGGAGLSRMLSGHVAMVAGGALGVIVAAAPGRRRVTTVVAWLLLTGTCLGIIVSRWHDTGDVVVALAIGIGWALLGRVVTMTVGRPVHQARQARMARQARPQARTVLVGVVAGLCALGAWLLVSVGQAATTSSPTQTLVASALAIIAATLVLCLAAEATGRAAEQLGPSPTNRLTTPATSRRATSRRTEHP